MRKIVDYQILVKFSPVGMEAEVKLAISRGWEPLGGPVLTDQNALMQAVAKYELYE